MLNLDITLTQLRDLNPHVRIAACEDLETASLPRADQPEIVEALMLRLQDSDFRVREAAVRRLAVSGSAAAAPALAAMLLDPDSLLQAEAYAALDLIGCSADVLAPVLAAAVKRRDACACLHCANLIRGSGENAELAGLFLAGLGCEELFRPCSDGLCRVCPAERRAEAASLIGAAAEQAGPGLKWHAWHAIARLQPGAEKEYAHLADEARAQFAPAKPGILTREQVLAQFPSPEELRRKVARLGAAGFRFHAAEHGWTPDAICDGLTAAALARRSFAAREEILETLSGMAREGEEAEQCAALHALQRLEFRAIPALDAVMECCASQDQEVRLAAARAATVIRSSFINERP